MMRMGKLLTTLEVVGELWSAVAQISLREHSRPVEDQRLIRT